MIQILARRNGLRRPSLGLSRKHRRRNTRAPIGRDFSDSHDTSRSRLLWAAVLVVGMLTALVIVHIRVRLIEEGYQRAAAVERVETLLAKRQVLKAKTGALRDRHRLAALAIEAGFDKPQQEIWLGQRSELRP